MYWRQVREDPETKEYNSQALMGGGGRGAMRIKAAIDPQRLERTPGLQWDPLQDCLSLRVCSISSY